MGSSVYWHRAGPEARGGLRSLSSSSLDFARQPEMRQHKENNQSLPAPGQLQQQQEQPGSRALVRTRVRTQLITAKLTAIHVHRAALLNRRQAPSPHRRPPPHGRLPAAPGACVWVLWCCACARVVLCVRMRAPCTTTAACPGAWRMRAWAMCVQATHARTHAHAASRKTSTYAHAQHTRTHAAGSRPRWPCWAPPAASASPCPCS